MCRDPERDASALCVVAEVEDLWAMERAGIFKGRYHVLGGTLQALDGVGPEELGVDALLRRVQEAGHRRGDPGARRHRRRPDHRPLPGRAVEALGCAVTRLGHGVPIGGELTYLDEGTLDAALRARQRVD